MKPEHMRQLQAAEARCDLITEAIAAEGMEKATGELQDAKRDLWRFTGRVISGVSLGSLLIGAVVWPVVHNKQDGP